MDKTSGHDGFLVFFNRKFWDIVEPKIIILMVCLHKRTLQLDRLNYAHVILIPKKGEANDVGDFRSINVLNASVKNISKVLTNRLRGVLGNIINDHRIWFLKGRSILNLMVIVKEVIQFTKWNKVPGFLLKFDFEKAETSWNGTASRKSYTLGASRLHGFVELGFGCNL